MLLSIAPLINVLASISESSLNLQNDKLPNSLWKICEKCAGEISNSIGRDCEAKRARVACCDLLHEEGIPETERQVPGAAGDRFCPKNEFHVGLSFQNSKARKNRFGDRHAWFANF
jgi:hypothetical protein